MDKAFKYTVLDWSLNIEDFLNKILSMHFRMEKNENKTLSHKSSSLTFKNKSDLLFDLNKIDKKTYDELICFMEIRNQFIHNLSTTNIIVAAERSKKINFLHSLNDKPEHRIDNMAPDDLKIIALEYCFILLCGKILEGLSKAGKAISEAWKNEIDSEVELVWAKAKEDGLNEILKVVSESIDEASKIIDDSFELKENDEHKGVIKRTINTLIYSKLISKGLLTAEDLKNRDVEQIAG